MNLNGQDKRLDYGLLALWVGGGLMFVTVHGWSKISGGVQTWTGFGKTFNNLIGVSFIPAFWGLMAVLSEFVGGLCLITGILFRPAVALTLFTMFVAAVANLRDGYGFTGASEAIECGAVFLSLIFVGPGEFMLSRLLSSRKK